jgi:hypothetical protein
MCIATEPRAVDLSLSCQFEEEIGNSSSENGHFIPKIELSVRTDRDLTLKIYFEQFFSAGRVSRRNPKIVGGD